MHSLQEIVEFLSGESKNWNVHPTAGSPWLTDWPNIEETAASWRSTEHLCASDTDIDPLQ